MSMTFSWSAAAMRRCARRSRRGARERVCSCSNARRKIFAAAIAATRAISATCIERPPTSSPRLTEKKNFGADLLGVTGGATDERLARLTIRESETLGDWMPANGVRWQKPLRGTLHLAKSNLFMLGGGKAMMNAYYDTAAKLGVEIAYETEVREVNMSDGEFASALAIHNGGSKEYAAKALVVASGGFEANIPWLKEYWGDAADNFIIRGTPHNQGRMLKELLRHGAKPVGDPRGCHAVALDARAPKFDGGIVTRLDSVPFGIVVNKEVKRFYDEGEDFWPKRYAIWGKLIAEQPDQIAYSIIDSEGLPHFMPSVFPPVEAGSIGELGAALGIDPVALAAVVDEYNRSVRQRQIRSRQLGRVPHRRTRSAEKSLGAAHRNAAVLRLSAAARHYVYLPRRYRE